MTKIRKKTKTSKQNKKITRVDMAKVRAHLRKVESIIKDKEAFITGNRAELFEKIISPKREIDQLVALTHQSEKCKNKELGKALLSLEYDTRQTLASIKDENVLLNNLEKDAKGTDERHILAEIDEEVLFVRHVEHQMALLESVKDLSARAVNMLNKEKAGRVWKERVGNSLMNLNNIAAFLQNMIREQEIPQLQNAYNLMQISGLPEARAKLREIKGIFQKLRPRAL